jgi:RNA polymerase sigma-70 factor, ECF subfamily
MLRLHLRSLGAREDEADDLAQQTMLVALERSDLPEEAAARAAWLRETARRSLMGSRGKAARRAEKLRAEAAEAVWRRLVPSDRPEDLITALDHCLEGLAPRARRLVEAFHRDRMRIADVAAAEGMSVTAVETALSRARAALRDCVQKGERS